MIRISALGASLASAGLLSIALPSVAQQAATVPDTPASVPQADATSAVASRDAGSTVLQVVTVTAQKRVEASSKVPVSLSVVSAEDLKSKGISTAANLTELVPNVQIGEGNAGGMEITIRGIGNSDNTERGDPQTAFHVDGIYIGRPQGAGATFFDLERVEVLRGPQGTLYGRNANAGAVNVITRKPTNRLEGEVDVEYGDYNTRQIEAVLNVPVAQSFALRAVISSQRHDGYSQTANATDGFTHDRDDQDNFSGRVLGLLKFSPTASWSVSVDASRNRGVGQAAFDVTSGQLPLNRQQTPQVEGHIDDRGTGVTSELKVGLGFADAVYLFGHRETNRNEQTSQGSAPSTYTNYTDAFHQNSHEVRLSSADMGALQWVAGLYYFKETGNDVNLDVLLPAVFGGGRAIHFIQNPVISESKAGFGQMTYSVAPDWRATLGLRTNSDSKSRKGQTRVGPNDTPIGVVGNSADGSWNKLTYRAGIEHDLSSTQMVYVSIATGYKAGGFNDGNGVVGDPNYNPNLYYKPETITSIEAGLKGRYLDNKLELGASVFHYSYQDLQVSAVVNNSLNTANAAKAAIDGLELEGRAAVTAGGRLNFALGLLSSSYDQYTAPNGTDFKGRALDRSPKGTLTLGYTQNWDLADDSQITAYVGTRYSSSYTLTDPGTATQAPRTFVQSATTKSSITLGYWSPSDRWHVELFGKNLESKSTATALFGLNGQDFAYLSEPRTFGARAGLKF